MSSLVSILLFTALFGLSTVSLSMSGVAVARTASNTGPTGAAGSSLIGPTGPGGATYPVSDALFSIQSSTTPARLQNVHLDTATPAALQTLDFTGKSTATFIKFLAPTGSTGTVVYEENPQTLVAKTLLAPKIWNLAASNFPTPTSGPTITCPDSNVIINVPTSNTNNAGIIRASVQTFGGITFTVTVTFGTPFPSNFPHSAIVSPMQPWSFVSEWYVTAPTTTAFTVTITMPDTGVFSSNGLFTYIVL